MGHTVKHTEGQNLIFHTFKIDKDKVTIVTDQKEWLETTVYDIDLFLKDFEILPDENHPTVIMEQKLPALKTITPDITIKLKDILMENIEKVKANRDYVHQAKVVANSAQTLINMAKLEIDIRTKL